MSTSRQTSYTFALILMLILMLVGAAPLVTPVSPDTRDAVMFRPPALLAQVIGLRLPQAQAQAQTLAQAQDERATVRVDGRPVLRVGPTADADARTRGAQVERRLSNLLENPTAIAPARIEVPASDGSARVISVAGVPVVTVTEADAQDNLTSVDNLATQWAQAIDDALQRGSAGRVSAWGRFTTEVQSSVATAFSRLLESALNVVPQALAALLILLLFWLIASTVRWLMRAIFRRVVNDLTTENLVKQVAYYSVWALGLIMAADALGFDPQTVVTGLGLTGLALGFALKDIISNFVSGLLILVLRPFRLGDQIVVGETEGGVERINLRATEIRTYDGRLVYVPNAELFTSRVTNNTASPVRRGSVKLRVGYESDLGKVATIAEGVAQRTAGVLPEPPPSVRIRDLDPDDIVVEVRFWTDSRRSDFLATASAVTETLVSSLGEAGISLPDPALRSVELRDGSTPATTDGTRRTHSVARGDSPSQETPRTDYNDHENPA